jgi:hypothetical protein
VPQSGPGLDLLRQRLWTMLQDESYACDM